MTEMEKLFEKMLNMELTNEEMFEQCRNVAHEPMTNEEWLKSLDTEQLAEFIADVCYELVDDICANYDDTSCDYRQTEKDYWTKWLKQPKE